VAADSAEPDTLPPTVPSASPADDDTVPVTRQTLSIGQSIAAVEQLGPEVKGLSRPVLEHVTLGSTAAAAAAAEPVTANKLAAAIAVTVQRTLMEAIGHPSRLCKWSAGSIPLSPRAAT
jgi:hypothetical protein